MRRRAALCRSRRGRDKGNGGYDKDGIFLDIKKIGIFLLINPNCYRVSESIKNTDSVISTNEVRRNP
jgi:hypothetical protein